VAALADAKHDRERGGEVVPDLVEYLIVAAPDVDSLAPVAEALSGLVRAGTIHLLDLVVLVRDSDGNVDVREVESIDSLAAMREVEGELGGLLSQHDLELASFAIQPGSAGLLLVTEDRWAEPLSAAARHAGGLIIAGERIPVARVEAVLADRSGEDQGDE
jgi:Family of unknown function (DUF6325)